MLDTEKDILTAASVQAAKLAAISSEGFVLAITAAYVAGVEAGRLAAMNPMPPAA